MVIKRLHAITSSILKPKVSLPNTSATFSPRRAASIKLGHNSRGVCMVAVSSRLRLVKAQLMVVSAKASCNVATMRAFSNTSFAPEAKTKLSSGKENSLTASGLNSGTTGVMGVAIRLGATNTNWVKPMVFMARAAEPMLAGCEVRASTTVIFCKKSGNWGFSMSFASWDSARIRL